LEKRARGGIRSGELDISLVSVDPAKSLAIGSGASIDAANVWIKNQR
jgi:hypothetical protein